MSEREIALPPLPVTIGVVGAGTMGAGIAQVALEAGHEVVLYDVDEAAVARGRRRIGDGLARRVAKRGLGDDDAAEAVAATLTRLREACSLEDVAAQAGLTIEAALEDPGLKRTIFRALDAAAPRDALLATNTSALSVAAIAAAASRPERVLGLHFFNPAPLMPLVEVVTAPATDPAAAALAARLMVDWGKTPVHVRDAPGFIVNRVNRPFTLEPLRMLEAEEAGIERIDRAVEAAGFPLGPFAYLDLVGLDVNLAVAEALYEAFDRAPRFEPSPIQRELVSAGTHGRKTGEGFYRYGPSGERLGAAARFASGAGAGRLTEAEIAERVVLAIVNEAYRTVGDGTARASEIDLAMRLGARHPKGPFEWARAMGVDMALRGLDRLTRRPGDRYDPAPRLRSEAQIGEGRASATAPASASASAATAPVAPASASPAAASPPSASPASRAGMPAQRDASPRRQHR